ncbi:glucuronate isomerase [Planctomycetes bacterium K23_9]|uniref:Glucuronate isomerase n=1 Tax=Stieleria marina TaxID=1930275 RepID=A0A517NP69_9BACT|nr:glucuronate isomerase [Planctomycetes bacterium K23_9]
MSQSARDSIYEAIASIRLVDPHTHINPHNPGSQTLADILGYHYYTELVHSAGMPKSRIEEDGISPRELVGRLVEGLPNIENTANYQWLINICKTFFDFEEDRITASNWESLFDTAEERMSSAQWPEMVLDKSNVEAVFLTNDFDDDLEGFDTNTYIPCLRTDDLVFHLGKSQTRERLAACSGIELDGSLQSLRESLRQRFEHFVPRGARACAISIPPDFQPGQVADGRAETALDAILTKGVDADASHHVALSRRVFWTLAELCDEFGVPFDLMIGVNRGVYPGGVYQGQDLYDSRVSLTQYRELFNAFPDVKFPVSVLASVTNQELVSHAWIFPNVITNGHWWYSNTPSFIKRDTAARLEAVPRNKQIGYYSDAYKLEFVWPKFDMYRNILADVLADYFVGDCGWSEEQAIELGYQVLRGNVDAIFPSRSGDAESDDAASMSAAEGDSLGVAGLTGAGAAIAASAMGMLGVGDAAEVSGVHEIVDDASELYDTVVDIQEIAPEAVEEFDVADEELDLDPNPSEDEIQAADVDDVELSDLSENTVDAGVIESEAEPDALDVGDLLGDKDVTAETDELDPDVAVDFDEDADGNSELSPEIQLLRGESGFAPDEASLQLVKDPVTGELTFAEPSADEDLQGDDASAELDLTDDETDSNDDSFGAGLEVNVELDEPADAGEESASDIDLLDFDGDTNS